MRSRMNDPRLAQHPQKYDYSLQRIYRRLDDGKRLGPIRTYHVDISKRTGTGSSLR